MDQRGIAAPAKVNLALHVGAVQSDGYHPIDSLCVFLDAGDRLSLTGPADRFTLSVDGPFGGDLAGLPPAQNLILKAAALMAHATGTPPVGFHLHKAVPAASGIGGGTSNGAAAMVLLNNMAPRPLSDRALCQLALGLGADGPVCLAGLLPRRQGGTPLWRAQGIGERVSPGPVAPPLYLCLANPGIAVPTGAVFARFDASLSPGNLEIDLGPRWHRGQEGDDFVHRHRNDLRAPAVHLVPQIGVVEAAMAARPGCGAARMSGSGATVFGLFADAQAARRAQAWFAGRGDWAVAGPAFVPNPAAKRGDSNAE